MKQYRYTLEPYKGVQSRYTCPQCGKKRVFCRYIDTHTGQQMPERYGRCNREVNCGYHERLTYEDKSQWTNSKYQMDKAFKVRIQKSKQRTGKSSITDLTSQINNTIPFSLFKQSLRNYEQNNLMWYLYIKLGWQLAGKVAEMYYLGTHSYWPGATVFWQVDAQCNICAGKVMLYDIHTGRRVKQPFNHVHWVHSIEGLQGYTLSQCLFGEHLLHGNNKTVAVVESEKTAMIASAFIPEYVWLATGGLSNLTVEKLQPLQGRNVLLVPDVGAEDKWQQVAHSIDNCKLCTLQQMFGINVTEGSDIADYLMAA
jgi:hypothetical protein